MPERPRYMISVAAELVGMHPQTLRLYEAKGLLLPPERTPAGYRVYPPETLGVLAFIGRARRLRLTLAEIGQIIAIRRAGSPP